MNRLNRRIALPIVMLALPAALGTGATTAAAVGYESIPGVASGPPASGPPQTPPQTPPHRSNPSPLCPQRTANGNAGAVSNAAVAGPARSAGESSGPIGSSDLALLLGAGALLLAIGATYRRSEHDGDA